MPKSLNGDDQRNRDQERRKNLSHERVHTAARSIDTNLDQETGQSRGSTHVRVKKP